MGDRTREGKGSKPPWQTSTQISEACSRARLYHVSMPSVQDLLDQKEWAKVMDLYSVEANDKLKEGNEEAAGFLMTHALVYAYLAGDAEISSSLEDKLKAMGRF